MAVLVLLKSNIVKEDAISDAKENFGGPAKLVPIGIMAPSTLRDDDMAHWRETHLGVSTAARYRAKGYGAETIGWTVDWAFRFAGVHRIPALCVSSNARSNSTLKKEDTIRGRRSAAAVDIFRFEVVRFDTLLDHEWNELRATKGDR